MRPIFYTLIVFLSLTCADAQILNGSFENGTNPDLSGWEWTCMAQSFNNAPPGGGNWCIQVFGGNTQGCNPGYAYQKLPGIINGQVFVLSGFAYAQTSPFVGLHLGKINNGIITLQGGVTTSSTSWTQISIILTFSLLPGDTALAVLDGGLTGGPVQGYGYFDLINLQQLSGVNNLGKRPVIQISPNPFSRQATFHADALFNNAILTIENTFGQLVKQINVAKGQSIVIERGNLPNGLYFAKLEEHHKIIATEKLIISD